MIDQEELHRALFPKLLSFYINKAISGMYQPFYYAVDNFYATVNTYNKMYNTFLSNLNKSYEQ